MTVAPVRQVASVTAAKNVPVKGKVLTIGQPIRLLNASGKPDGAGTVLRRLTSLGWTMRLADSLGRVFGVCANEMAPGEGRVVAFDYGCGAHSDVVLDSSEPPSWEKNLRSSTACASASPVVVALAR